MDSLWVYWRNPCINPGRDLWKNHRNQRRNQWKKYKSISCKNPMRNSWRNPERNRWGNYSLKISLEQSLNESQKSLRESSKIFENNPYTIPGYFHKDTPGRIIEGIYEEISKRSPVRLTKESREKPLIDSQWKSMMESKEEIPGKIP